MTILELTNNESLRQREFPVCADKIFLAHAAVSPLPRCVTDAMQRYLEAAAHDHQEAVLAESAVAETRQLVAQLTGARADEIAFTGSTSMGLAMVASGLAWQPGDNVVCYRDDYPANVYPWMDLANPKPTPSPSQEGNSGIRLPSTGGVGGGFLPFKRLAVEIRFVEPQVFGNITVDDLARVIDSRTRLVSLASAHFVTGWRLDVDAIGKFLHDRGILFCLDAIQTLGALHTSFQHVDFAAADAHKWLLGPLGTAILFVRREHFDALRPPLVGWSSAACPGFIAQDTLRFWPDARRYEPGSLNLVGIVGLHAALQMIQELGIQAIEERVLTLARQVCEGVSAKGWQVLGLAPHPDPLPTSGERESGPGSPRPVRRGEGQGEGLSGIVSFTKPGTDLPAVHANLTATGINISLRQRRDGSKCLRVSPHFYNTEAEIERMLDFL